VGQLQQALVEVGEPIDATELQAQSYSATTEAAVRAYQGAHGLDVDGIVGPRTWRVLTGSADEKFTAAGWRCSPSEARPGLVEVLRQGVGLLGTVEQPPGSNRGPLIDGWCSAAGLPLGSPWCAAFATAMYGRADRPIPIMGSSLKVANWGRQRGLLLADSAMLLPGDIGCILRGDGHGHVVLVGADLGGGMIATVEGNSGSAVRGLLRARASFACFVRPMPL
jgi:hypothetical protein